MNKAKLKKSIYGLFVLIVGLFIIYSIYIQLEYKHHLTQSKANHFQYLSIIANTGNNLSYKLNEFIQLHIEQEEITEEMESELFKNWRIVNGESKSIFFYSAAISTLHTDDNQSKWSLLQYSLFRINDFIHSMTNNFLEHHSYVVSSEEYDKLEAVITVYNTIYEQSNKDSVDLDAILKSIKEPMLVIDDHYQIILDQLDIQ